MVVVDDVVCDIDGDVCGVDGDDADCVVAKEEWCE